jgi:hypothetical protein
MAILWSIHQVLMPWEETYNAAGGRRVNLSKTAVRVAW